MNNAGSEETIVIKTKPCLFCKETHEVTVNKRHYQHYQNGMRIQNALPELSPAEHELLISGSCPKCMGTVIKRSRRANYDEDDD